MGASDFAKLPHIGESVRRKEDYRFLTGAGQYTDDINLAEPALRRVRALAACACRASRRIDTARAEAMPGVARVFTGKDVEGKMGGLPCGWLITSTDGTPMKEPPHPILAQGKVRYVGDHVAMVVADTLEQARERGRGGGGRLRRAARGGRRARRAPRPAARCTTPRPTTSCYKWAIGDKARGGRGVRQGGARHQARPGQQPPGAQRDGAARGDRLATTAPTTSTRCTSPTRTRTSSAC